MHPLDRKYLAAVSLPPPGPFTPDPARDSGFLGVKFCGTRNPIPSYGHSIVSLCNHLRCPRHGSSIATLANTIKAEVNRCASVHRCWMK
jgi:hypothetical protein